ncbi:MAG: SRPBCC family protein [bacterium]
MEAINKRNGKTLTIKRTFDAPIQIVWQAWSNPKYISQWWGHKGMEVNIIEHNFKVGGAWLYSMPMPDGKEFISEGVYSEIKEPNKIVTSANFKPMTEGVTMEMFFEDAGKQTNFTFNVHHVTEEYCKQQEEMGFFDGWGSIFVGLENYLIQLQNK